MQDENVHFDHQKTATLAASDLSKKGSIDEPIFDLVKMINWSAHYFTTSSCSGRVVLFSQDQSTKAKSSCRWHFTSHQPLHDYQQFASALSRVESTALDSPLVLKFEPFILHIQCRSLSKAKLLHTCALECGFRNSGLTVGKGKKVTLAVRGALCLEVPLGNADQLLVNHDYLRFIMINVVGDKFKSNAHAISKFECAVKSVL